MNRLILTDFRIHHQYTLDFLKDFIVITGPNGTGKTSILEAIYLLSTTKSFRTNDDIDLINTSVDTLFSKVSLELDDNKYEIVLTKNTKRVFINDLEITKFSNYFGSFGAIVFSSSDIEYLKGYPSDRRKYFDMFFSQIDREYLRVLIDYKNVIKQKNLLLKSDDINLNTLGAINSLIVKYSGIIYEYRNKYINLLNNELPPIYHVNYNCDFSSLDELALRLDTEASKEIQYRVALYGVHKDDYTFLYNDKIALVFASGGQARMLMVHLKLAFLEVLRNLTNKRIILLLDDILSELDSNNQNILLSSIPLDTYVLLTGPKDLRYKKGYQKVILKGVRNE